MLSLPTPRTINEADRQIRTVEYARQIIAEGYSFWPDEDPEMDMVAISKPGTLCATYLLMENGTACDCLDFQKHQDYCKHIIAYSIVQAENIPTMASTNLQLLREFVAKRDAAQA